MSWGWLKALVEAILPFLKDTGREILTGEVKAAEARTSDETKRRFEEQIRRRLHRVPPPEPPADGR